MSKNNENKKWFGILAVILWCLLLADPAKGTTWRERQKLLASDGAAYDWFGRSVSISGDYAIVGAVWDDDKGSESGSAYVFMKCPTADLSGDCFVNFADFAIMANQWLQGD
jgi:hypothetical protein